MSNKANYLTHFSGAIDLSQVKNQEALDKIAKVVDEQFGSFMNYNKTEKVIYINGDFDNSDELVEKFCKKLSAKMNFNWIEIKVQGQNPTDRYDIILNQGKVHIQEYETRKSDLREYV